MELRVVQSTPKLILEWDPVPGAVAGYRGKAGGATKWTQTQQTRMTFAANATEIVIQALGVADEGQYPQSAPPPPVSAPGIPTGLAASVAGGEVTLTWNPNPASDQVDVYQVYLDDEAVALDVAGTTYVVTGLAAGSTHTFRVSAHNVVGYGDWGAEVSATIPGVPPDPEPEPVTANVGWFSWGSPTLPPSHIADYDLISTGPSSYSAGASAAKKVYVYKSCISVNEGGDAYGVSAAQARAINAILKSTSGAEMINASYPTNKLADPGLAAYQDLWCQQVWGDIEGTGVDGLFIDDTLRTYVALSGGTLSQKYPKPTPPALSTWETAMRSWANAIYTFFSARGIEVVYNCNGYTPGYFPSNTGQSDREFWDILMPYADGFCTEYLHHNPTYPQADKLNRSTSYNQGWGYLWEEWQKLPARAEVLGVQHWSLARGPSLAVDYNLCSQLLETKRGVAMWIPNGSPGEAWHATYDKARTLGAAAGAKFKSGDEWRRDFAGGQVRVNPVAATASIV